jgi:post-segregation antitoxin (ccd killing protein)
MRMARVNVYLPDELAQQAKELKLNISALTQDAIKSQMGAMATNNWLESLRRPKSRTISHESVMEVLREVRDEAPTYHG